MANTKACNRIEKTNEMTVQDQGNLIEEMQNRVQILMTENVTLQPKHTTLFSRLGNAKMVENMEICHCRREQ